MKRQPLVRLSIAVAAVAVAGIGAVSLRGQVISGHHEASPALTSPETSAPGTAALRAYLDPETGAVTVGTPGSRTALSAVALDPETQNALRRDSEGLVQVHHPDGSVSMDLQGRYQCAAVAHVDENGKIIVCTDDVEGAEHALQGGATTSATPEVK
jgi:hypothetical protein